MELNKSKGGKKLYTGFFSGKVVAINPTKEELADLLNYELDADKKDIEYEGKTEKGDDYVMVSFWLEADTPEKQKFNARFRLVDKTLVSEKSNKVQFVNQTGTSTWVDNEKNLPEWFTHFQDKNKANIGDKVCREGIQGEANLYTFLRALLGKVDFFNVTTNILIDKKRMFRNVDQYVNEEYRSLLKAEGDDKVITNLVALASVYTGEKDGEVKHYQNLYSEFIGQYNYKKISLAISSGNWMADDKMKKLYEQITGEYGCKDAYTMTMLQEFDPANHETHAGETTFIAEGGTAEDTEY